MSLNPLGVASSDAPIGTESAAIVRDIFRKRQTQFPVPLLGNGGVYTTPWFDTELTGTTFVQITSVASANNAATTGCQLQESEDKVNVRNVYISGAASINRLQGYIRARYWHLIYTNGVTPLTSISLFATESSMPIMGVGVSSGSQSEPLQVFTNGGAVAVVSDAVGNQFGNPFANASGTNGAIYSIGYLYNGTTWDRPRTPATFKQATATASGNTALWTPTAGKKFRLMRFKAQVTGESTLGAAARLTIGLQDSVTDLGLSQLVFVPNAVTTPTLLDYDTGWIDLGNGILSSVANNVLNINLSAALTAGVVNVVACGTEE